MDFHQVTINYLKKNDGQMLTLNALVNLVFSFHNDEKY